MATTNVEKYASGTGERDIDINRRESPFKITYKYFRATHPLRT